MINKLRQTGPNHLFLFIIYIYYNMSLVTFKHTLQSSFIDLC